MRPFDENLFVFADLPIGLRTPCAITGFGMGEDGKKILREITVSPLADLQQEFQVPLSFIRFMSPLEVLAWSASADSEDEA